MVAFAVLQRLVEPARRQWLREHAAYPCGTLAALWVIERVVEFWRP